MSGDEPIPTEMRTRVKICGVRRVADALAAEAAGADAIGVVCYPKAGRYADAKTAREIVRSLGPFTTPVALFVDQPVDEIRRVADQTEVRLVQLHGSESPAMVAALQWPAIKAVSADRETVGPTLDRFRRAFAAGDLPNLRGIVLETAGSGGGAGLENDWTFLKSLYDGGAFAGLPPVTVAGGLSPENVGAVIRLLHPYAVDVSSGVERTRGEKDVQKLHAFFAEVRQAQR